jgi:hypothetical protein
MPINLSGSLILTGSLTVTGGINMSGSIASASYAFNASYLNNSGSGEFVPTGSFNTFSSSILTYTGSANSRFSSIESTTGSLNAASASAITRISALEIASGSAITRLSSIESKTGSYATTGSNTFVDAQYISQSSNPTGFTTTASLYTDGGLRVGRDAYISGTLYLNNLTVFGTQSVAYISSSQLNIGTNIISVNTDTPSVRFGGLAVYDSGSTGLTGSILWDSQNNHWVYSNPSGSSYSGGMFISGPRTSTLGSETGTTSCMLLAGQGGDHLTSSAIYHNSTVTCIPNTLIGSTVCTTMINASCIGIGTQTPGASLDITSGAALTANLNSSQNTYLRFQKSGTSFGDIGNAESLTSGGNACDFAIHARSTGNIILATNFTEKARIDSSGNLTVGSTAAGNAGSINVSVGCAGTTAGGLQLWAANNQTHYVQFGDGTAGGAPYAGYVAYAHATDSLSLGTGTSTRVTISSTGIACFSNTVCVPNFYMNGGIINQTSGDLSFWVPNVGQAVTITQNTGRVGIGTTSPYQNLQVYQTGTAGNNYVEGTVQVGGTNTTLGAALSYAAQNSGYVNLVNLNTSGGANARISLGFGAISSGLPASTVMTLNQSGNVGIGTATPSTKLEVNSSDLNNIFVTNPDTTGTTTGSGIGFKAYNGSSVAQAAGIILTSNTWSYGTYSANQLSIGADGTGGIALRTACSAPISFFTGCTTAGLSAERMRITSDGYVAVTGNQALKCVPYLQGMSFGWNRTNGQGESMINWTNAGGGSACDLTFNFRDSSTLYERMRLTSTGNVGIGTSSPSQKLSLGSPLGIAGTATAYGSNDQGSIMWSYEYTGIFPRHLDIIAAGSPDGTNGGGNIRFFTNPVTNGANSVERMRITSAGRVGIGQTGPGTALSVAGQSEPWQLALTSVTGTAGAIIGSPSANVLAFGDWGGTERMRITSDGYVGIGTIAPNISGGLSGNAILTMKATTNSRVAILELNGCRDSNGDNNSYIMAFNNSCTSPFGVIRFNRGTVDGCGSITLATSGTDRMFISSCGNVGIGTTSLSTEAKLFLGAESSNEGGQLVLQKGTSCSCATHLDNYEDKFRILVGTDTSSNGVHFQIDHKTREACFYGQVRTICGVNASFYNGPGCRYNFTNLNTPQDLVGICANNGLIVFRDHTAGGTGVFLIDPNQGVICMASNIPATVAIAWNGSTWRWCLTSGSVPRCLGYGFYGA